MIEKKKKNTIIYEKKRKEMTTMSKDKSYIEQELAKYDRKIEELKENRKKKEQELKSKVKRERTKRLVKIGALFEMIYDIHEYEDAERFLMEMRHHLKKSGIEKYQRDALDLKRESYQEQTLQVRKSIEILDTVEASILENYKKERGE